ALERRGLSRCKRRLQLPRIHPSLLEGEPRVQKQVLQRYKAQLPICTVVLVHVPVPGPMIANPPRRLLTKSPAPRRIVDELQEPRGQVYRVSCLERLDRPGLACDLP